MPKLAIYVPKDEMKIVDKWRKKLNFSKIFMRALQQEIQNQSRKVKSPKDKIAAAAEHYKSELSRNSKSLVDFAFELGSGHVLNCRLDAHLLRQLLEIADPNNLNKQQHKLVYDALVGNRREIKAFLHSHGYDVEKFPTVHEQIARGYVQGVAAAWKQIREKM